MLIKSADDKSNRIALLEGWQMSTRLDQSQKDWLRTELSNLRKGIQGERDAAFYIDSYYRDSENHAVIHDLRIIVNGVVAQIDHLIINRTLHCYVLETKNYNANISISNHGEFSVTYVNEKTIGIPSPIEQSKRHEQVLIGLLDNLDIKPRAGIERQFHHVVLIDPKGLIKRPEADQFDSSMVIKSDQFESWRQKHINKTVNVMTFMPMLVNLRGAASLKELAEKIARQHRPSDLMTMPDWMKPKAELSPQPLLVSPAPVEKLTARYFCAKCKKGISQAAFSFCFNAGNKSKFGGRAYCMDHQKDFQ